MVSFPKVELTKIPVVDEVDAGILSKTFTHFFKKLPSEAKLHLSFKEYDRGGLKKQHEIHAILSIDSKKFFASEEGWELISTIQSVLDKLEREVSKKLRR